MAQPFRGVVNVDIRESVPDWSPFEPPKAPEGAPNVVYIVLDDVGFSAIFRFAINPLFLFSGTFFPLTQLPEPLRIAAWATPLFHGVELIRGSVLGTLQLLPALAHLAYLGVMLGAGVYLAGRLLQRRMAG